MPDVSKGTYVENVGIWVEGQRIKEAGRFSDIQEHPPKAPAYSFCHD